MKIYKIIVLYKFRLHISIVSRATLGLKNTKWVFKNQNIVIKIYYYKNSRKFIIVHINIQIQNILEINQNCFIFNN